jgi:hypothetical protein
MVAVIFFGYKKQRRRKYVYFQAELNLFGDAVADEKHPIPK